jgi:hypothetical protein
MNFIFQILYSASKNKRIFHKLNLWEPDINVCNTYLQIRPHFPETYCDSVQRTNRLTLLKETFTLYYEIHAETRECPLWAVCIVLTVKVICTYNKNEDSKCYARADSRRLPTAETRVQAQFKSCRICSRQSVTEAGFLGVLQFLLSIITSFPLYSSSPVSQGCYNRPNNSRRTKWTISPIPRKP